MLHDEIDCDLVLSPSWHDEVGVSHPRGDVVVKGRLDVTVVLLQHVSQVTTALGSGQVRPGHLLVFACFHTAEL